MPISSSETATKRHLLVEVERPVGVWEDALARLIHCPHTDPHSTSRQASALQIRLPTQPISNSMGLCSQPHIQVHRLSFSIPMMMCPRCVLTINEDMVGRLAPLRTQYPTLHQPTPQLTQPTRQRLGLEIITRLACFQRRQEGPTLITTSQWPSSHRRSTSAQPSTRTSEAAQLAPPDLDPRV